ncbi:phage tail protein [Pseudoalteromonas sp. T1lg65]|uniref:phage tail protein n=1 Tax=Pseudoalteromonas sp. T1lg65 TaxID=2077101 RepID=UPI003F7B106A
MEQISEQTKKGPPLALLPPTCSPLLREVWQSQASLKQYDKAIANLTNMKAHPHDAQLMWLVWEYGLESILPYSQDLRKTLKDGLAWQRIRGTPKSLTTALSWLDLHNPKIENTPSGSHHYSYQIDTGTVPGDERVEKVVKLAKLSAPVSSQLTRIYHGYDVRKQMLSSQGNQFGNMLSDYSGTLVTLADNTQVKISFGRYQKHSIDATPELGFLHHRSRSQHSKYLDEYDPNRYCLTTDQPSALPNQIVRQHTVCRRYNLAQWPAVGQSPTPQLCAVTVHYSRRVNALPLKLSGASTGRMNYGVLNLTAVPPS